MPVLGEAAFNCIGAEEVLCVPEAMGHMCEASDSQKFLNDFEHL